MEHPRLQAREQPRDLPAIGLSIDQSRHSEIYFTLQSKGATILALIAREGGATAAELQQATGWQPHSVRGFLSTAGKKGLAKIASAKRDDGQRVYGIA